MLSAPLSPHAHGANRRGEQGVNVDGVTVYTAAEDDAGRNISSSDDKVEELGDGVGRAVDESDERTLGPVPTTSKAQDIANQAKGKSGGDGYARCRDCGELIDRDVSSIENHERICPGKANGIRTSDVPKASEAGSPSTPGLVVSLRESRMCLVGHLHPRKR